MKNNKYMCKGIRVDNGDMAVGYYLPMLHNNDNSHVHTFIILQGINVENSNIDKYIVEVIPETVGQYIGECDKNGVMLFENDIVRFKNKMYQIKYFKKYTRFLLVNKNGIFVAVNWNNCELMGEKYNHPELLK